jgi:2-C-methyl-D-erythritol 4-phosphate cytidylyltransferase
VVLDRAYALVAGQVVTDDAGLAEHAGATVRVVDGHPEAFKVTGPLDLVLAEAVLRGRHG